MSFRFQTFPVYKEVRVFIKEIYQLSSKLPSQEKFELASQLRRAATSILLNLAEGSMRGSDAELNRFLLISIGSIGEVVAILDLCLDNGYVSSSIHAQYMVKSENIVRQLQGFRRKIKNSKNL